MSSQIVVKEIKRFLSDSEPEVLCIQGKWGVGKTFAWKKYYKEAREAGEIGLKRGAYVSLFGINDLGDLKQSIFENTYEDEFAENAGLDPTLTKGINVIKSFVLRSGILTKQFAGVDRLAFLLVRNQIVCIDDIERAGKDLSINDVLGLISFLKTERNCKVVILMNNEELGGDASGIYEKQKEKVTDIVLTFDPTAQEAAEIVFPNPTEIQKTIKDRTVLLGIKNIRVIKRIERNCERLLQALAEYPDLHYQAIHSTTLFTWSILQPNEAPPIDFIKNFRFYRLSGKNENEMSENEKAWGALLNSYQYFHTDELDLLIIEGIRRGYFGGDVFEETMKKLNAVAIRNKQGDSISKAWDVYHGSFDDNEKEMLDGLYNANLKNADVLTAANLNSAVKVLKEFERTEQATALIDAFVKAHATDKSTFDLKRYSFREDVNDDEVEAAFNKQLATFVDSRDPGALLESIMVNHGWNPGDIERLQKLSADDFYKLFKSLKGSNLHKVVAGALQFLKIQGIPDDTKTISTTAIEALKKIGKENRLNKKRVASYGIKVDDEEVAQTLEKSGNDSHAPTV